MWQELCLIDSGDLQFAEDKARSLIEIFEVTLATGSAVTQVVLH